MASSLPKPLWRSRCWMPMTMTQFVKRYCPLGGNFYWLCSFRPGIHFNFLPLLHFSVAPCVLQSVYSESVPEDSPAGRLILQVSATDADIRSNAQISYELQGVGSELFIIDSDTGAYLCSNGRLFKKGQQSWDILCNKCHE